MATEQQNHIKSVVDQAQTLVNEINKLEAQTKRKRDMLKKEGIELDLMRVKAFPFNLDVWDFIEKHDYVYVVEQNRDSQMRTLLMAEGGISAEKLRSLVWFNGQPIEANFIAKKIREREPEKI